MDFQHSLVNQTLVNKQDSLGRLMTTKPQTIPANGRVMILGQTRVKAICQKLTVCLDGSNALPRGVIVTPCVSSISPGRARTKLPVELVNHLSQDVTIPAKVQICDLYSTEEVDQMENEFCDESSAESEADASFLRNFSYLKEELDSDIVEAMKSLLLKWKSAFSTHDLDLGLTDKVTHRIRLKDDVPLRKSQGLFRRLCLKRSVRILRRWKHLGSSVGVRVPMLPMLSLFTRRTELLDSAQICECSTQRPYVILIACPV